MKTIKIIDLLNKIANGEEVPKEIKYDEYEYYWCNACKVYERGIIDRVNLYKDLATEGDLNDEVEILDEAKILDEEDEFEDIEEMDVALLGQCDNWLRYPINEVTKQDIELNPYIIDNIRENTLEFQHKINELIKNQKKIIERLKNEK